ncbi:hypothetical protein HMPREF9597_00913 [Cutibacterium acnes HL005PA4]|nr:hypothetical protein HMPREF1034_2025 [Cutibacterium acnes SK187]EFS36903.1 hypothetical protein HMPREF9567_00255 [Cutibacterium acnes HL013PA1]EFS52161.1 hypothetical protein HMPREF9587_00211 [Cutibacterium acnes HL025PA1]EFS52774.1 hypothetical protein HMPREF9589_01957 [Cutibacterium acnes HL059PA1]EFS66293.1 hypothetical protein HMPREF9612_01219 [Cutibacterium acnes HL063PA2]EFS79652.1 hypothetical protein HMPREF9597_00913 [Cutibacterium acnes HL005PA4]EFS80925.1 hypothetical protein HMP
MGRLVPRLSRSQDQGQGATGAKKKGSDEKSTAHVLFFAERGPPIETVRKFRE